MEKKSENIIRRLEIGEAQGIPKVATVAAPVANVTDVAEVMRLLGREDAPASSADAPGAIPTSDVGNSRPTNLPSRQRSSMTVLVVDDDAATREEMSEALEEHNLLVISAGDAAEALELAKKHRPGFVIMDFNLPGMNGLDAITAMRKFIPDATVILMSGCRDFCRIATTKNTKTSAILQKPVSIDGIARFINGAAESQGGKRRDVTSMVAPQ